MCIHTKTQSQAGQDSFHWCLQNFRCRNAADSPEFKGFHFKRTSLKHIQKARRRSKKTSRPGRLKKKKHPRIKHCCIFCLADSKQIKAVRDFGNFQKSLTRNLLTSCCRALLFSRSSTELKALSYDSTSSHSFVTIQMFQESSKCV